MFPDEALVGANRRLQWRLNVMDEFPCCIYDKFSMRDKQQWRGYSPLPTLHKLHANILSLI